MKKYPKFIAFLAVIMTIPAFFSPDMVSAAVLSAPSLKLPANNQVLTNFPRNATFSWNSVYGADRYDLEIACDVCVSKTNKWLNVKHYNVNGTSITFKVPGADNQFRWRVRAYDGSTAGNWSAYNYFKYNTKSSYTTAAPTIYSPTEDQVFTSRDVNVSWTSVSGAVSYEVNVNYKVDSNWVNQDTYTTTQSPYNMYFFNDNDYRLRVRAKLSGSSYGNWSNWREFTVDADSSGTSVGTPTLVSPADGATISQDYVNLDWSNVTGATSYEYEVTKYNGSSWESIRRGNISTSDATVTLPYGDYGQYSLHVRANKNGSYGSWSEYHQFYYSNGSSTTGAPAIYSPYENQTFSGHDVSISWSNVSGATSYEVNVNYYQDDSWVNQGTYTAYTNPYSLTLYNDNNYRLRVRAVSSGYTYGNWSDWREFVVAAGNYSINKPTITFPSSNGETFHATMLIIKWTCEPPTTQYELEKYNSSSGLWELKKSGSYSAVIGRIDEYRLSILSYGEGHYRVRARMRLHPTTNYSDWSDWRDFYLYNPTITTAPTINQPYDNQVISGNQANITWNTVPGVSQYGVFVSANEFTVQTGSSKPHYDTNQNSYLFEKWASVEKYDVHVCLMFGPNQYGACSPYRYFELSPSSSNTVNAPTVYSPTEDQTLSVHNVSIGWSTVSGASAYEVNVNYYQDGSWVNQGTYTAYQNPYSLTLSYDNNYRLRVRAKISDTSYSNWSDWREFIVDADASSTYAPTIYNPSQNALIENSTHQAYLSWGGITGVSEYYIEMIRDGYSAVTIYPGSNASYTYTASVDDAWYHFRVRARLTSGYYTDWSGYRYFHYLYSGSSAYNEPVVNSPTEDQVLTNRNVYMSWTSIASAVTYEVNVNYVSGSNWVDQGTYSTSQNNYNLYFYYDNDYRMRVRAKFSDYSYGSWSDWRVFEVDADSSTSGAPSIYTPSEGTALNQSSRNVTLGWYGVSNVSYYEIQASCNTCAGGSTEWAYNNYFTTYNTSYTWYVPGSDNMLRFKVRAFKTDSTYTPWSDWRTFHYFQTGS